MPRVDLLSFTLEEAAEELRGLSLPKYRAGQIFAWLHKGVDFPAMVNLPADLRTSLAERYVAQPAVILENKLSGRDDTVKFLFGLQDGQCVEGVMMRYRHGRTLCVSTQAGCRMGCVFCASAIGGRVRNLTPGEMLGQVVSVNRYLGDAGHVSRVVLMGSGEPLDNYANVIKFLRLFTGSSGAMISMRRISLSTCGLVPEMLKLAREGLPVTLCVSLHAPNDAVRVKLIPAASSYPIEDVLQACRNYTQVTGRRVILEYALIDGVNTSESDARELAERLRGMRCHVNLIPLNPIPESGLNPSSEADSERFEQILKAGHVSVTRRRELGDDIGGACGQLRRSCLSRQEAMK